VVEDTCRKILLIPEKDPAETGLSSGVHIMRMFGQQCFAVGDSLANLTIKSSKLYFFLSRHKKTAKMQAS